MSIYDYEGAFGAWDKTSVPMRKAISRWFSLYYRKEQSEERDTCQQVAYTVVSKLVKSIFGEYRADAPEEKTRILLHQLETVARQAVQLSLIGGESYVKPCPHADGFVFRVIPRDQVLIFGRNLQGEPTDVGTVERLTDGSCYYTLLERRILDEQGRLTVHNRLYRSRSARDLGVVTALQNHPLCKELPETYRYQAVMDSVGLVPVKTPILNCIDGSADGVSVYAAAEGLIRNIDQNEAMLCGEFSRGKSRVFASEDLLKRDPEGRMSLEDSLFVGLDDAPDQVGLTIFSPQLRYEAYLERKQEYLRNVETVVGLKRGMLSDANVEDRTATEIASSAGEFNLTVLGFQKMWQEAVKKLLDLCVVLGRAHGVSVPTDVSFSMDWGNGVLYDEEKHWENYMQMVSSGLLRPEVALAWRFGMPCGTEEEEEIIRKRLMPRKAQM